MSENKKKVVSFGDISALFLLVIIFSSSFASAGMFDWLLDSWGDSEDVQGSPTTRPLKILVRDTGLTPLSGASVQFKQGTNTVTTKTTGTDGYTPEVTLTIGQTYNFVVSKSGYQTQTTTYLGASTITLSSGTTTISYEYRLPPITIASMKIRVKNANTNAYISGASVTFRVDGNVVATKTTNSEGLTDGVNIETGKRLYIDVIKSGYSSITNADKGNVASSAIRDAILNPIVTANTCTDSDSTEVGYQFAERATKGTVTINSNSYIDECVSSTRVREHYCTSSTTHTSIDAECSSGMVCSNGACVENTPPPTSGSCEDTDGSSFDFQNSEVLDRGGARDGNSVHYDKCDGNTKVVEYYCNTILNPTVYSTTRTCASLYSNKPFCNEKTTSVFGSQHNVAKCVECVSNSDCSDGKTCDAEGTCTASQTNTRLTRLRIKHTNSLSYLQGVSITATGGGAGTFTSTTDNEGYSSYMAFFIGNTVQFTFAKSGYQTLTQSHTVTAGDMQTLEYSLIPVQPTETCVNSDKFSPTSSEPTSSERLIAGKAYKGTVTIKDHCLTSGIVQEAYCDANGNPTLNEGYACGSPLICMENSNGEAYCSTPPTQECVNGITQACSDSASFPYCNNGNWEVYNCAQRFPDRPYCREVKNPQGVFIASECGSSPNLPDNSAVCTNGATQACSGSSTFNFCSNGNWEVYNCAQRFPDRPLCQDVRDGQGSYMFSQCISIVNSSNVSCGSYSGVIDPSRPGCNYGVNHNTGQNKNLGDSVTATVLSGAECATNLMCLCVGESAPTGTNGWSCEGGVNYEFTCDNSDFNCDGLVNDADISRISELWLRSTRINREMIDQTECTNFKTYLKTLFESKVGTVSTNENLRMIQKIKQIKDNCYGLINEELKPVKIKVADSSSGNGIFGASVEYSGPNGERFTLSTDRDGLTVLKELRMGIWTFKATRRGYIENVISSQISPGHDSTIIEIKLTSGVLPGDCANECVEDATICFNNGIRECGNFDSDFCLEWGEVKSCGNNNICPSGKFECDSCGDENEMCCTGSNACDPGLRCDGRYCVEEEEFEGCINGCSLGRSCVTIGYRESSRYCDLDGFEKQKNGGYSCENDWECVSNSCLDSECVDPGLWKKILTWFKELFG